MAKRNLLLCFDAFGTLFRPKKLVAQQYGEVARQCGLSGFSDEDVQASFRKAFKSAAKAHPNYGKASNMGAERWWTNIIHDTFQPLIGAGQAMPAELAPRLLHRFASSEGYSPAPGLATLIKTLRTAGPGRVFDRVIVGVISNSDDRVPGILSSLGLHVSPLRFGAPVDSTTLAAIAAGRADIDFHCMSYDVGVEKPDPRIFLAADSLATQIITAQGGQDQDLARWDKLYVGDDYAKDVVGARQAGWRPVYLGTSEEGSCGSVLKLEKDAPLSIDDVFEQDSALGVASIESLVNWLCGSPDQTPTGAGDGANWRMV